MNLDDIHHVLTSVQQSPFLPLVVFGAIALGGAMFLPVWVLMLEAVLVLQPPVSMVVALGGALTAASIAWTTGRFLAGAFVARRVPNRVLRTLQGAEIEGIIALRLVPLLPFTLVNVGAGACAVPYRTFLLGTAIGMAPGIVGITLVGEQAAAVLREPSPTSIALLLGTATLVLFAASMLRRWAATRPARGVAHATIPSTSEHGP